MFQYLMVSILIAPVLIGVGVVKGRDEERDRRVLRASWIIYAVLWFALLYYLRVRWS